MSKKDDLAVVFTSVRLFDKNQHLSDSIYDKVCEVIKE